MVLGIRGLIWTMTVREYLESSRWRRLAYRLVRNPFVLFVVAPLLVLFLAGSFHIRMFWCRICPMGAVMALISRWQSRTRSPRRKGSPPPLNCTNSEPMDEACWSN